MAPGTSWDRPSIPGILEYSDTGLIEQYMQFLGGVYMTPFSPNPQGIHTQVRSGASEFEPSTRGRFCNYEIEGQSIKP